MSSDLQIVVNLKGVFMGKLKEKLKKNYGITSDAELLEELNNMESVDLGIFVTQIDAEKTA